MMKSIDKKGQAGFGQISDSALSLMIVGIILVFGVIILTQIGDLELVQGTLVNASDPTEGYTNDGSDLQRAYNDTLDSVTSFSDWLPIVALLAVASVVLFMVVRSFPRTN